jgi:lysozyme
MTTRNISDNGLRFTAAFEQFKPKAYKATPAEKHYTIGFGHYGADVKPTDTIAPEGALLLLEQDMAEAVRAVDAVAHRALTQAQFDAVCDLVFNVGPGCIVAGTGTGAALRAGDVPMLRAKLALFVNQGGKPLLGLRRRATGRISLFDGASGAEAEAKGRAVS